MDELFFDEIEMKEKMQNAILDFYKNDKRFEKTYSQGTLNVTEVWVDRQTGVNYVFHASGDAGGMTVLLDRDGKPVITPIENG